MNDIADFYVLDKTKWPQFASILIEEGYRWSGHTKIDKELTHNHGVSAKMQKKPFAIHIYDKENKLICYKDLDYFFISEDGQPVIEPKENIVYLIDKNKLLSERKHRIW